MATCMLCSSSVADDQVVCPHCGGAVEASRGPSDGSPWSTDPTRVEGSPSIGAPSYGPVSSAPGSSGGPAFGPPAFGPPAYEPPAFGPPAFGPPAYGPPAYGPPAYGAPAYGAPGWGPVPFTPPAPTEGMAVTAFVVSLVGLVTAGFCGITIVACPVGAVLGHLALRRIATTGAQGRGLALAGVIIGWIGTAIVVLLVAVLVGLLVAA